ncbi:MAG: ATP-dependent RecD-like DNA helicase [Myxococcales bacterium]
MATLEGTVDHVVYSNDETHYAVAHVRPIQGTDVPLFLDTVTVVGTIPAIAPGQDLRLDGDWVTDPRYGRQFRVRSFELRVPATIEGIEAYLASGLIKGVGPVTARRMVEAFGEQTLAVIATDPSRLLDVEGIGEARARDICRSFEAHASVQAIMVTLHSVGISSAYASRIVRTYGDRAVEVVRNDPYRLADEVVGIGFKIADAIAARVGIDRHSPRRAEAGIVHVLSRVSEDGHLFCERGTLLGRASQELDIPLDVLESVLPILVAEGRIVFDALEDGATAVYPARLYEAERRLGTGLAVLSLGRYHVLPEDAARLVAQAEAALGLELAALQRLAVASVLERKVVVITGGPGTGKTTILRAVVHALVEQALRVALCAPTGRAAKRMTEATGARAMTVHRLLEWSPRAGAFQRNEDEPLSADAVIVDESSMLDVPLADALVAAVPAHARLVLVGDVDQLPPVGPGAVLKEIIASGVATVIRLDQVFRQGARSAIVTNAHRINHGELPETATPGPAGDFHIIDKDDPQAVLDVVDRLLTRRIPSAFGLDPVDDVQILCPMHRGDLGAERLNQRFQALLNPEGPELRRGTRLIREGDKVMQIRNNYDKDVYNGDVGRVTRVDPDAGEAAVRFDEREVLYEAADLDELVLAYAVTVHKSQGSEYPAVILPLHTQHYMMLQRNLLYTAVTRGRRLVVVVGPQRALKIAVERQDQSVRATLLASRIRDAVREAQ